MGDDGLPAPRRYWATAAQVLGTTMVVMDTFAVNVVLPDIAREFGVDAAGAIWVVNAFNLIIIVSLFPLAALGERLGYRTVSMSGVALFTAASLLSAFAPSIELLVAARLLQGLGASCVMATNTAIIRHIFPASSLGRGLALNAAAVSFAAALGPTLASGVLSLATWRWVFAIDLPLGLAALAMAWRLLPDSAREHRPFDLISTVLNVLTFGGLILGAEELARDGGGGDGLWALLVGVAAAVLLIRRELGRPTPLVPLDLMRNPMFSAAAASSALSFAAQALAFVSLPFYVQSVIGLSAVETGLVITPWMVAVACAAPLSGWLADRFSPGALGAGGMLIFAGGLVTLVLMPHTAGLGDIVWRMMLCGFGFVMFQAPNNRLMIMSAPRSRSGAAASMVGVARLLGQIIGAVGVGVCFHLLGVKGGAFALGAGAAVACVAALTSFMRFGPSGARPGA